MPVKSQQYTSGIQIRDTDQQCRSAVLTGNGGQLEKQHYRSALQVVKAWYIPVAVAAKQVDNSMQQVVPAAVFLHVHLQLQERKDMVQHSQKYKATPPYHPRGLLCNRQNGVGHKQKGRQSPAG